MAILVPILVLIAIGLLIFAAVLVFRRRRQRRRMEGVTTGRLFG
jgi:LPXTG-motif cell wall-anchored protein